MRAVPFGLSALVLASSLGLALLAARPVCADVTGVVTSFQPGQEYTPGQALTVSLTVTQFPGGTMLHLEDEAPAGWVISEITPPGQVASGKVVWDIALQGSATRTLSYRATPPDGASGAATFAFRAELSSDTRSQVVPRTSRVVPRASPGCALTCQASASPVTGTVPLAVTFAGQATATTCRGGVSFAWDFGDGSAGTTAASPSHVYSRAGTFTWQMTASVQGVTCQQTGTVRPTAARRQPVRQTKPVPSRPPHGPAAP